MKYCTPVKVIAISILAHLSVSILAQVGGTGTYKFLTLTNSARVAALGSKNISLNDGDLNLVFHNPALLNEAMDNNIALSYIDYFAGIGFGHSAYAFNIDSLGTFNIGAQYVDYGTFREADRFGNLHGNFYAKDLALNFAFSRAIDSAFRVGITLKPVFSSYERYTSYGIVADLGATYTADEGRLTIAVVLANLGSQLSTYTSDNFEPMPFEILLGVTHKLQYAPFRISLTAHNLQKYNMLYDKPEELSTIAPGDDQPDKLEEFADNFFRHIVGGVEFLPSKSFYISGAYNYQRKAEMALADTPGIVGFSFGTGIRLKRFSINYGRAVYHAAGGSNHFSLLVNLGQTFRK